MSALTLTPNLSGHDDLYQSLVALHEGLSEEDSLKVWAKLALLLANQIGDRRVIAAAIAAARPAA